MHEVSVISDIVKAVLGELSKHDITGVDEVSLVIGELTNLGEDQMTFAFEVMTKDTILSGSRLVIEYEPVHLKCKVCDFDGPAKILKNDGYEHTIPILSCPDCNGGVNVTKGMECCVKSIKVKSKDV